MLVFEESWNSEYPTKTFKSRAENQQTQSTCENESGNRTRMHRWQAISPLFLWWMWIFHLVFQICGNTSAKDNWLFKTRKTWDRRESKLFPHVGGACYQSEVVVSWSSLVLFICIWSGKCRLVACGTWHWRGRQKPGGESDLRIGRRLFLDKSRRIHLFTPPTR